MIHAIIGRRDFANAWAIGFMLSRFLTDPFIYVICNILRVCRRLADCEPELFSTFLQMTVEFQGKKAFGPASSFKSYLDSVGWSIDQSGILRCGNFASCDVAHDSISTIISCVRKAWPEVALSNVDRKGVGDFLPHAKINQKFVYLLFAIETRNFWLTSFLVLSKLKPLKTNGNRIKHLCALFAKGLILDHIGIWSVPNSSIFVISFPKQFIFLIRSDQIGFICLLLRPILMPLFVIHFFRSFLMLPTLNYFMMPKRMDVYPFLPMAVPFVRRLSKLGCGSRHITDHSTATTCCRLCLLHTCIRPTVSDNRSGSGSRQTDLWKG